VILGNHAVLVRAPEFDSPQSRLILIGLRVTLGFMSVAPYAAAWQELSGGSAPPGESRTGLGPQLSESVRGWATANFAAASGAFLGTRNPERPMRWHSTMLAP
jgi:hypothetical protein